MEKVENIVFTLSRLANVSEEETKKLIEKYSTMSEIEIIKDLSMISYRLFSSNEGFYNYALTLIRSINPSKCPPVSEMKNILGNMYNNISEGNMDLKSNHRLVNESLDNFTTLFNEAGIDYYIVGALPCFIKTGQPLFRYHEDIDIMINEDDISKAKELMELCGYEFHDDRFPTTARYNEMQHNKPPHLVLAQNPDNEFHLGFFCFKREIDKSITMREYSHRLEDDKVVVDVLERRTTPEGTKLRYDEEPTTYMHTSFKTSTIESVYHLKSYTRRPKDLMDMKKLKPHIDKEKLSKIKENPQENVTISNVGSKEIVSGIKRI
ncbi:MAG: hypothetical protein IJ463_06665 [Bacilli bacterium]|nr:hypothetical protein [Bacilli bacterium]